MTSDPTIDAIDHALADYTIGPDGMRWTPEADSKPNHPTPHPQLLPILVLGTNPTAHRELQDAIDRQQAALQQAVRGVARVITWAITRHAATITRLTCLLDELQNHEATQRRTQMHAAYRHRQLARRRRNRRR